MAPITPLLLNWRLLRKTSYLKNQRSMRNGHIQSAKMELERLQKQGNTAANKRAAEQRADQGNKSRNTPLLGKEKGDTVFTVH